MKYVRFKRLLDVFLSICLLIILGPIFAMLFVFILLLDGWPVFFLQKRVGKSGNIFWLYKFRSMRVLKGAENGVFAAGNNSRVTIIGRFIRKSKLDELPQLVNVLKGDMSLVGPRPEVEKWVQEYPNLWRKALAVKPGITDNASILFRNEEELLTISSDPDKTYREVILPHKLLLYCRYVDEISFIEDMRILIKTVWRVIT